jgi:hypothetical protein
MVRYWPRVVTACRRRYGSVFTLRIASVGTLVYLTDPSDIKEVFAVSSTESPRHAVCWGLSRFLTCRRALGY